MPPEAEDQKETQQPKSSRMKILVVIAAALVLLAGGGAGAYYKFFMVAPSGGETSQNTQEPVIEEMDTFLVNLSDPGGKRFLKATIKVKMNSRQSGAEFRERIFEMRDLILMIFTSKEVEEITRPEDKMSLKQEIMAAINRGLRKGQVQDIYFTEFLIQ